MNNAPADLTAEPPREGWSQSKLIFFIALALAAHIAFIFIFGTKKLILPRPVTEAPHLQLADNSSELIALDDPTLFVLPHANDYVPAFWQRPYAMIEPDFRWTEAPRYLPIMAKNLGASFNEYMQTNPPAPFVVNFKPPPPFAEFPLALISSLPQNSTLQITDDLAQRHLLTSFHLPSLPYNDVITPSKIQVLVDAAGEVTSTILLQSDDSAEALGHWYVADTNALAIARTARFTPAAEATLGELIFNWHTIPATNSTILP